MSTLTSQKITELYERFKNIDITYSKEIIQATGMVTKQVYLKCGGDFWPCVVYSSSFESAKVVINLSGGIVDKLQQTNNVVSLRFCFKTAESGLVTFFVFAQSAGYAPYGKSPGMAIFTLNFTQRPPDDLIEIIGRVLDANINSAKRRDKRIHLTTESQRKLKLVSKESAVLIQGAPQHCILRDLSFSGAKVVFMGTAESLLDQKTCLYVDFEEPRERFILVGNFVRTEIVEGRGDLAALAVNFITSQIPMGYKMRINDYFNQFNTDTLDQGEDAGKENPAAAPPVKPERAAPVNSERVPPVNPERAAPINPERAAPINPERGKEHPNPAGEAAAG